MLIYNRDVSWQLQTVCILATLTNQPRHHIHCIYIYIQYRKQLGERLHTTFVVKCYVHCFQYCIKYIISVPFGTFLDTITACRRLVAGTTVAVSGISSNKTWPSGNGFPLKLSASATCVSGGNTTNIWGGGNCFLSDFDRATWTKLYTMCNKPARFFL